MSTAASVALMVGSVVLIAAVWIAITRRRSRPSEPEPEPAAVWLRPMGHRIAHAFLRVAVSAGERHDVPVVPLRHCGTWPVGELVRDDSAPRCAPCERAVERMEHRQE